MYSKIWQAGKCKTVCGSSQDGAERTLRMNRRRWLNPSQLAPGFRMGTRAGLYLQFLLKKIVGNKMELLRV